MLALRGVPGIYFHSLVGTRNYTEGVQQTGHNRTINRRKFDGDELREILADEGSVQRKIFDGYHRMLAVRIAQPAFHPDADQTVQETDHKSLIALVRNSLDGKQQILVLVNVGEDPVVVNLDKFSGVEVKEDLLGGKPVKNQQCELAAHDIAWLA
jgi:sucrose phosphorylase